MSLYATIEDHIKDAMRSKEQDRLLALRNIKAAFKHEAIELKKPSLDDAEAIKILNKLAKQRRESIETYQNASRQDLADKEKAELAIIQSYLPQALSEAELDQIIKNAIQTTGASGPQGLGVVMKAIQPQVAGRADGKVVSEKVKQALS